MCGRHLCKSLLQTVMSADGAQQNKHRTCKDQLLKLFICVVECFSDVTYWVSVVLCLQFDVLRLDVLRLARVR